MFQLYNFYVLYVLNTSHKLYLYMKLYMMSELSISCVLFTLTAPPHGQCAGGTHPTGMHSCFDVLALFNLMNRFWC